MNKRRTALFISPKNFSIINKEMEQDSLLHFLIKKVLIECRIDIQELLQIRPGICSRVFNYEPRRRQGRSSGKPGNYNPMLCAVLIPGTKEDCFPLPQQVIYSLQISGCLGNCYVILRPVYASCGSIAQLPGHLVGVNCMSSAPGFHHSDCSSCATDLREGLSGFSNWSLCPPGIHLLQGRNRI